ncbi:hypothetical protein [Barrientosiimonas humi]|uniref:hypothetical protein n=1 Tax=Barrientosiimonas humi TaxID=999931 RepID=UPI00370D290D
MSELQPGDGTTAGAPADPEEPDADKVVGLYGDPSVSWSILIDARLTTPQAPEQIRDRLRAVVAEYPTCGTDPSWSESASEDWPSALAQLANREYDTDRALVRGLCAADGSRFAVAAHHGAVDGLGLLGLLGPALGVDLRSSARGLEATAAGRGFLAAAAARVVEALIDPPRRFRAEKGAEGEGSWLAASVITQSPGTARLVAATAATLTQWNGTARGDASARRSSFIGVGASRRTADSFISPERSSAYLRLARPSSLVDAARDQLHDTTPEPDFPPARVGGLAPLAMRLLRHRLGNTALVSNLGVVHGGEGVISHLTFYPQESGPRGVAVAAVTLDGTTTLTVRARRADFTEPGTQRMLALVADALAAQP